MQGARPKLDHKVSNPNLYPLFAPVLSETRCSMLLIDTMMQRPRRLEECRNLILTTAISVSRTIVKRYRHHGCDCSDGWEGDHCEQAIQKASSALEDIAHGVGDALSGDKIVWIIVFSVMGIFSIIYFRRYHLIKQRAKASNNRRRRKHQHEMTAINDTRDII